MRVSLKSKQSAAQLSAFGLAIQAGKAREFAHMKANLQFKKPKSEKKAYKPGMIGVSVVAEAIKSEHGEVLSRKERREDAKLYAGPGHTFKPYYNGNEPRRVHHNIKPNKYAISKRRKEARA